MYSAQNGIDRKAQTEESESQQEFQGGAASYTVLKKEKCLIRIR